MDGRTKFYLNSLQPIHLDYLKNLKETKRKAEEQKQTALYEQTKATARGYISALVNAGITPDFKTLWVWFTV